MITVIFQEISTPVPPTYPQPLVYAVDYKGAVGGDDLFTLAEEAEDEILDLLAKARAEELSTDDVVGVRAGLELLFAFEGDRRPVLDWRNE